MEIGLRQASHNISHICHYLVCFEINLITKKILRNMKVPWSLRTKRDYDWFPQWDKTEMQQKPEDCNFSTLV